MVQSLLKYAKRRYRKQLLPAYNLYRAVAVCPPRRTARQKERFLTRAHLTVEQIRLVEQMSSRISPRDQMYAGEFATYVSVGLSAIECIDEALVSAGSPTVKSILDLPCGHGRVLRLLKSRFPQAAIVACEIDRDCVKFCQEEFDAKPAISRSELENLDLGTTFDLIWCGSLITHFTPTNIKNLLQFSHRHLAPGGVLAFSAHGTYVRDLFKHHNPPLYGVSDDEARKMLREYAETGCGFAAYPDSETYGISLTSRSWLEDQIREIPGWELKYFAERKWDNHHDVYGIRRTQG